MPIGHFAMIIHRYISFFTVVCVMQCMSQTLHGGFSIDDRERNADHVRSLSVDPQNAIWYLLVLSSDGVGFQWRQETFRFAVVH